MRSGAPRITPRHDPAQRRRVAEPGIYDMPEADYHADPAPAPSLSASVAKVLVGESPAHAWVAHPRLNPAWERPAPSADMAVGSAVHALLLGKGADVVEIDADDYRAKDAREARDDALAAGKIPLKAPDVPRVREIVEAARGQLARHLDCPDALTAGKPEQVAIWREGPIWCRSMVDWLPDDPAAPLVDLKTTGTSASPDLWSRQCFRMGYDVQAALYGRGIAKVRGCPPPAMLFVVVETEPPYALTVFTLDPGAIELGRRRAEAAIKLWTDCLRSGRWPGYTPRIHYVSAPAYVEMAWGEREIREQTDRDLLRAAAEWQRPLGDAA